MSRYLATLAALNLAPTSYGHPPVASVDEARVHWASIAAAHTKNLLLKDDTRRFWLVVMPADMQLDLKALPAAIGSKRLRFAAADDLVRLLGVESGAVSPLALVNDTEMTVTLAIEESLLAVSLLAFHPLRNDMTVTLSPDDLARYLAAVGHRPVAFVAPGDGRRRG